MAEKLKSKSATSSSTKVTMDTGIQHLCHFVQPLNLNDTASTDVSPKPHDMLQLTSDPEKLALAQTNTQNSPLLRLPAELRNKIYDLVLDKHSEFHTRDAPRRKQVRQSRGEATTNDLALLSVCRQLYSETCLLPLVTTPFTFHTLALFSKHLAQNLLPTQVAAIKKLKCPFEEVYFPGFGINSAFLSLLAGSLTGVRDLTLMEVTILVGTNDRKVSERIEGEIREMCGGLEVKVELRSERLE